MNALQAYTHASATFNCHTQYVEVNMFETRTVTGRAGMKSVVQYRGSNEHHNIFACVPIWNENKQQQEKTVRNHENGNNWNNNNFSEN